MFEPRRPFPPRLHRRKRATTLDGLPDRPDVWHALVDDHGKLRERAEEAQTVTWTRSLTLTMLASSVKVGG